MKKVLLSLALGVATLADNSYAGASNDFDYYKAMGISKDDRISFDDPSKYGYGDAQWAYYFIMDPSVDVADLERAPGTLVLKKRDETEWKFNHQHFGIPYPDYYKHPETHYLGQYTKDRAYSSYLKSPISNYPRQLIRSGVFNKNDGSKYEEYPQRNALRESTYTIVLGTHDLSTISTRFSVDTLASGTRELNSYLGALVSNHSAQTLSSMPSSSACTKEDRLTMSWNKDSMVSNMNFIIAMSLSKLTRPSVMDYNLNFSEYVKGKTLYVSTKRAKERLQERLSENGVTDAKVQLVSSDTYSPKVPLDGTYFAVKRNNDEIKSALDDYWGFDKDHKDFYEYRYGYIDDVRFDTKASDRKPIDGFFQEIAKRRGVANCEISLEATQAS